MTLLIWLTFIAAAVLEVGGDALIRRGLRGSSAAFIVGGCLVLSCYGVAVNIVKWDFSKILGVYFRGIFLAPLRKTTSSSPGACP